MDCSAVRARCGRRHRDRRLRHAGRARRELHDARRGVRLVSDRLDRLLGGGALSHHARDRQFRDHQGLDRRAHRGPPAASDADRVCVRRVHRRRGGFRHPCRGGGGDDDGAGFLAVLRGRHLPARQYRAGRVRLDRHSGRHARDHHGAARGRAVRVGRTPLRADFDPDPCVSDSRDGRLPRPQGRFAGGDRLRRLLRLGAVPRIQLRRPAARRYPGRDHCDSRLGRAVQGVAAIRSLRDGGRHERRSGNSHEIARLRPNRARLVAVSLPRAVRADLGLSAVGRDLEHGVRADPVARPAQPNSTPAAAS